MDLKNIFGYENETVMVTGGASGMGKATAELLLGLGADVWVLDYKEPTTSGVKFIQVDLKKKKSIDAALKKLPSKIDKDFETAGIGGSANKIDTVLVNFFGHRYLVENILPRMPNGTGAVVIISSLGGMGWMMNMVNITPFLEITDWEEAKKWLEKNKDDPQIIGGPPQAVRDYAFSKECIIAWVKGLSYEVSKRGIRVNTISPGITNTPLLGDLSKEAAAKITPPIGRLAEAIEQAWTLVFLNSKLASYISGADIPVDYAFSAGILSGKVPISALMVETPEVK